MLEGLALIDDNGWTIPGQRTIVEPAPWHDLGNTEAQFTRSYLDEVGESQDPLVYFNAEWPVADRQELARKSNLYRMRKLHEDRPSFYRETDNRNRPWPPKYLQSMKPTNENEISRLIAFQMGMGLIPLSVNRSCLFKWELLFPTGWAQPR